MRLTNNQKEDVGEKKEGRKDKETQKNNEWQNRKIQKLGVIHLVGFLVRKRVSIYVNIECSDNFNCFLYHTHTVTVNLKIII